MATIVGDNTAGRVKRECRVVFTYNGRTIATSRLYLSANTEAKIEEYGAIRTAQSGGDHPQRYNYGNSMALTTCLKRNFAKARRAESQ